MAQPFDLLVTLYLDGREKAERKIIVYLDPNHEDFKHDLDSVRLEDTKKTVVVMNNNHEVLMNLQRLSELADAFAPRSWKITNATGDLGDLVDRDLTNVVSRVRYCLSSKRRQYNLS